MKKLYTVCFLFALLAFVSCSPEEDDIFDKTAAERIAEVIEHDLSVLQGAKNGWVMEYYPSVTKMYGGYSILVSFETDGTAKVSCDLYEADKVTTSKYDVKQSTGPLLTFDTYNEIFHFFSEPSNALGIGETGKGMEGDYEFLIVECTPEKVVLKGKKTGNSIVMTPIPESETWNQYLGNIIDISRKAYLALYDVNVGIETEYTVRQEYHTFILAHPDGSEERIPFVYTTGGIKFYEPIAIGAQQVQDLKWNDEVNAYEHDNVAIKAKGEPEGYVKYDDFVGSYLLVYNNGNAAVKVTLVEEMFNSSFIMKGLPRDIHVVYKSDKGVVGIETQVLGGSVMLCPYSKSTGGYYSRTAGDGLIGENDSEDGQLVIYLVDTGVWGATASVLALDVATKTPIFQVLYVVGMIKQ